MVLYFQRPENALKRANELIEVGRKQGALDALYDVIKSRKHRTWQKIHEPIMSKYLELCVELKKSHVAKEGLFQYRNICQQVNIKSLEDVVRGYLNLAETKTEAARAESQQAVVDIDDLDQVQTPENLLMSAVSSEDTQDRTDRVVLTPWVKFLWESYRQCLELLRNNSRIERLYHDIAEQAFRFCLKYNRKTEFRKLCDNLRAHLGHIHKHQNQQTSVNMNNPDSQNMHLETRLVQLDSAIHMELWQEAYKAIEDIHGLMNLSKKAQNPRLMANYYQKLSLVFWKSGNYLFHAAALFRLFYLNREQKKNITSDEMTKMASRVVLATLSVPMPPNRTEIDRLVETDENVIDKNHRLLTTLLGLSTPPSRALLIKDLVRFGIIQYAPSQLQELYRFLEVEFHPMRLCTKIQQHIDFLTKWEECPELSQYVNCIQNITIVRLVKEVSQVYRTIKFNRMLELAPFIEPFALEYLIVEVARRNDLQVRIDHEKECFHFGSEMNISLREEVVEGPHLQSMPSERMRKQLVSIHSLLNQAAMIIRPDTLKKERKELSKDIVRAYSITQSKEHQRILGRQQIIEARKEMLENINYQKEAEERKLTEDKQQKLREAEKERMAREAEERAKQRILREQSEMKRKVVMEKIEQLKKTEIGSRIFEGMAEEELEKLDPDDLINKHVEQLDRERKELQNKLRKQEKVIDHMERAKRIEELPLLKAEYEEIKAKDMEFWDEHEQERIKAIEEERAISVQYRDRLMRLRTDRDAFLDRLKTARSSVYQQKLDEFETNLAKEKKTRMEERRQKRKESRRAEWVKKVEEDRQREVYEKLKREREEEQAKMDEILAKQKARELEIEEKIKKEKEELEKKREEEKRLATKDAEAPKSNWREREAEKKQSWARDLDKGRDPDEGRSWRKKTEDAPREERGEEKPRESAWRRGGDAPARDSPAPSADADRGSWRSGGTSQSRDKEVPEANKDRFAFLRSERPREGEDRAPRRFGDGEPRRIPDRDGPDSDRFRRFPERESERPRDGERRFPERESDGADRDRFAGLRSERPRDSFGKSFDRDGSGRAGESSYGRDRYGGDRFGSRGGDRPSGGRYGERRPEDESKEGGGWRGTRSEAPEGKSWRS